MNKLKVLTGTVPMSSWNNQITLNIINKMDTKKNIVIGKWFCADLGIAIAERFHDFYYEEYNHIPEGKKVGDYKFSAVEYKQFCDYEGKPTRRNRFKECNKHYCGTLNKKWEKVLNNSIKNYPKEYESSIEPFCNLFIMRQFLTSVNIR